MKVLLTGSRGMVGGNIAELKPANISLLTPSIEELDLLNYESVLRYIRINQPDIIIHAAGIVGGIQANINYPVRFLRENTILAHNLIWAAYETNTPKFLNLGSSCMYPKNAKNPLKEEMVLAGELEPTNEGYALSKIFAQRFCKYINFEQKNNNFKTIIPCNLYGKYDKFDNEWGHMIPSVIRKIHDAKLKEEKSVCIWGNGEARREFMFSEDFADFIWFAVNNFDRIPELLNVGLGSDYSVNEYYKIAAEIIGYQGYFEHDLQKPVGMHQKLVDITMLSKTGWKPSHSIESGIKKTYSFYLETIKKI